MPWWGWALIAFFALWAVGVTVAAVWWLVKLAKSFNW